MRLSPRILVIGTVLTASTLTVRWAVSADSPAASESAELRLPPPSTTGGMPLTEALAKRRSCRSFEDRPLSADQVAQLCWAAQGMTDPQSGKRTAPSAHALYPATLLVAKADGVFVYEPKTHRLVRQKGTSVEKFHAAAGQPSSASAPVSFIIALDIENMKPRSGEKAEQYSLLEAGHIAQNLLLQATALGLAGVPAGGINETRLATALALRPNLRPVYLVPIGYPKAK
ncbi:MAG: dehydrogenase [Phycisphaerae bacterium]